MLEIRGLSAAIDDKPILRATSLGAARRGALPSWAERLRQVDARLCAVGAGEDYVVTGGSATFDGHESAGDGAGGACRGRRVPWRFSIRLSCPVSAMRTFLRTALNALRRSRGESELDAVQF